LKTAEMSNFLNICPLGAKLFGMDRQTDIMTLIVTFHSFTIVPNKLKNQGQ